MQGVLSSRAVAKISGAETRGFLQGLVSQDIQHVAPGAAVFTALLTPQGKILFDFLLTPTDDGFFIDCDADAAPMLLKRLMLYKLRAKIAIEPAPELVVWVSTDAAPTPALAAFIDPRLPMLGRRWIAQRADGAPLADDAYDNRRLSLGVPEFGRDFSSEDMFLLDVNYDALNAVSYKKGCFVGQEVTSRMKRKGEIRKRTLLADFTGAAPAKAAPVLAGDAPVGEILSGRGRRALALIRLDRLQAARAAGLTLRADGGALELSPPVYLGQN